MATLTVVKFYSADGANAALETLQSLQKQRLINIQDAAIVAWPEGKKRPKTKQLVGMAGLGSLQGAFWGMLFGLIFFIPFFGMAVGAALGALTGRFADYGIDDDFIKRTRDEVTEGTSALFLMSSGGVLDRISDAMKGKDFEIIATNLSKEQEEELQAAFGEA